MLKKGFVHIISLVAVVVIIFGGFAALSNLSEQRKKEAVSKVLSSSEKGDENKDEVKFENSKNNNHNKKEDEKDNPSKVVQTGAGSDGIKSELKDSKSESKFDVKDNKTKMKAKDKEEEFETEVENEKEETEIRTEGLKIRIVKEDNRVVYKFKNENDEDIELNEEEKDELFDELSGEFEDDDIEFATGSAELGFIQKGRRVRTNFPLSVNPATGELFVSTPAGEKVVTVLPDIAVQNMIKAGIMTRVDEEIQQEGTPSAQLPEGTPAASVAGAGIELTEENGEPVYFINGIKDENLLGLIPVEIRLKTVVSTQNGSLIDIKQGIFSRLLDLLSF